MNASPHRPPIRWVFLDRDGTINAVPPPGQYIIAPEQLELLPGAAAAIRCLNDAGVWTAVVTNQRGIALGAMTERDLLAVHLGLHARLAHAGAHLDAIYHCPHDLAACSCRKPQPGLLLRAQSEHPALHFAAAAMVGDNPSDMKAGRSVGAESVLIAHDSAVVDRDADHIASTLFEAVEWLGQKRTFSAALEGT